MLIRAYVGVAGIPTPCYESEAGRGRLSMRVRSIRCDFVRRRGEVFTPIMGSEDIKYRGSVSARCRSSWCLTLYNVPTWTSGSWCDRRRICIPRRNAGYLLGYPSTWVGAPWCFCCFNVLGGLISSKALLAGSEQSLLIRKVCSANCNTPAGTWKVVDSLRKWYLLQATEKGYARPEQLFWITRHVCEQELLHNSLNITDKVEQTQEMRLQFHCCRSGDIGNLWPFQRIWLYWSCTCCPFGKGQGWDEDVIPCSLCQASMCWQSEFSRSRK